MIYDIIYDIVLGIKKLIYDDLYIVCMKDCY